MISNLIALTALASNTLHQSRVETTEVILILARGQDEIDFSDIPIEKASKDEIAKKGVICHEFQIGNQTVFISEQVAPIYSLEKASKLTAELQRDTSSTFAYGSEIGKQMREVFESVSPRIETNAKPEDHCYGIVIQVSFNSANQPLKTPVTMPVGLTLKDVAAPVVKQATPEEQKLLPNVPRNSFFIAFSEFARLDYVIKPLTTKRRSNGLAVESFAAITEALRLASERKTELHQDYAQNHSVLLDRLKTQYANELKAIPREGAEYDKLPKSAQDMIFNQMKFSPESFGFTSTADAENYLKSNPIIKVDYTLSIYEGKSKINPRTGQPNRQGTFVNLGNPTKPGNP